MTVADSRKYRVILSGGVLPEKSRTEVVEALAVLFNSRRDTMEQLLRGKPVPLTKRYEREQADTICRAIRQAGAECAVEEIRAPEASVAEAAEAEEGASATATATEPPPDDEPEAAASAAREEASEQASEQASEEAPEETPEEAAKQAAVARFVEVNTGYYLRQFAKFGGAERCAFALSWHWPAFLAFFFWAVHRKLWLWAGAHLFGSLILLLAFQPGIVYLIWALVWPLTANYLYCRRVRDCVFGNLSGDPGAPRRTDFSPDADLDSMIHGGVSRVAVALAVLLMFVLSLALNSPLSERVLQYSERAGGGSLLPGPPPGSQQRGDGSSIEGGAALTPRVATTVTLLNGLAAALKLAASDITPGDRQQALFVFRQVVARAKVKDAWGTAIAIQEDAAGQVALVSAGPDERFDSDDDILQYIRPDDG